MGWDDPFKPVDFGSGEKEKQKNNTFEPVSFTSTTSSTSSGSWGWDTGSNAKSGSGFFGSAFNNEGNGSSWNTGSGNSLSSSHWSSISSSTGSSSNSNFFSSNPDSGFGGAKPAATWGWNVGEGKSASSLGKHFGGDSLGFSADSTIQRLKEKESNFGQTSQNDWATADTSWHFRGLNQRMEEQGILARLESRSNSSHTPNFGSSNWAFSSTPAPSWGFSTEQAKNSSWGFSAEPPDGGFFQSSKLKRWA